MSPAPEGLKFNSIDRSTRKGFEPEAMAALTCAISSACLSNWLIDAAGNFESFGMVGDGNVFIAASNGGLRHFRDRCRAIAPKRVHLQIALYAAQP